MSVLKKQSDCQACELLDNEVSGDTLRFSEMAKVAMLNYVSVIGQPDLSSF